MSEEELLPKNEELPPPNDDYLEIEVSEKHGGWLAWEKIPVRRREQLIAHHLHKARRDAYYRERVAKHAKAAGKKRAKFDYDPLEAIKKNWGAKY